MNNNPALVALLEADSQAVGILNEVECLRALLHFLDDFFELETMDPNNTDERIRTISFMKLSHYREYRSLSEMAFAAITKLRSSADTLSDTITDAVEKARAITT